MSCRRSSALWDIGLVTQCNCARKLSAFFVPTTICTTTHRELSLCHLTNRSLRALSHISRFPTLTGLQFAPRFRRSHRCGSALLVSGSFVARLAHTRKDRHSLFGQCQHHSSNVGWGRSILAHKLREALYISSLRQSSSGFP